MRAVFFGTPQLAVPSLEAVAEVADVARVICQPDRPAGRGLKVRPPPVKVRALELGLEVEQPKSVRGPDLAERLRALGADVAVVVAYGRILPRAILDAPAWGCVNVHASLLPRWRGAGPIQWAIVSGDEQTGVCLMRMDEGMDTGPVLVCEQTFIDPDETAAELGGRLAIIGARLLTNHLRDIVSGAIEPKPQPTEGVTKAPLLRKEDGRIDWSRSARAIHDQARGLSPWPGAFTEVGGRVVKIHRTRVLDDGGSHAPPGAVLEVEPDGIEVACGEGRLALLELQLEGKRRMRARAFLAGSRWSRGLVLGSGDGSGADATDEDA
ncbi:MAG: methionyl-tRNA formyltransferase [Sandaracinaceae bacterium]